jgi:hypothetical protein
VLLSSCYLTSQNFFVEGNVDSLAIIVKDNVDISHDNGY